MLSSFKYGKKSTYVKKITQSLTEKTVCKFLM